MSVGRDSIRRAANAGAGKTVKKPVVSTKGRETGNNICYRRKEKNSKGFCSY